MNEDRYDLAARIYPKDRRPPAKPAGKLILISDGAASPTIYPAYSDGVNWRKFSDGSAVS